MSRSKLKTYPIIRSEDIVETNLYLIETIKGETLFKVAHYLRDRSIQFDYLLDFLRKPLSFPGSLQGIQKIVDKFLRDAISKRYAEIHLEKLSTKFVYQLIYNQIFQE